ncbi:MAG: GntR family transcriptional regulator [Clostridiales bacterium]|nr:GntR family transcriptional regulator [Clostridiales bacterium]MDY5469319.1 GntR family transcriptional regulator [Eubacteriales bacterium]
MYNGSFDLSNESKPIRDIAYDRLKHAIITGELPAGSRIVETTYAEQLHISRTPLREALRKLERDGLVEYVLRRGVVVRAFTINDIEEIFTIRNAMMILILPSVIKNVTDKDIAELRVLLSEMDVAQAEADCDALATFNRAFHSKIEHLSDKTRILRVIDDQEEYITRFAAITIASIVRRSNAHQEHHQMVDLLEKRDLPGMMKLMEHHLDESKQTCLEAVSNHKY